MGGESSLQEILPSAEEVQGAFGAGLEEDVCKVYNFLATNYEAGDEISIFGFSRGAFTARASAGLVCRVGLCEPHMLWRFWEMYAVYRTLGPDQHIWAHEDWFAETAGPDPDPRDCFTLNVRGETVQIPKGNGRSWYYVSGYETTLNVKVVGVWDTVLALGIPNNVFWNVSHANRQYAFHDTRINVGVWNGKIQNAFHALALDEHRAPFTPTLWKLPKDSKDTLIQCWFPGVHINVGGGKNDGLQNKLSDREFLANITFSWMVDRCAPFVSFFNIGILQIADLYFKAVEQERRDFPVGQPEGWSLGPMVDSYTYGYRFAGSITRKPGAYFPELSGTEPQWITNECVHPVVGFARENTTINPKLSLVSHANPMEEGAQVEVSTTSRLAKFRK